MYPPPRPVASNPVPLCKSCPSAILFIALLMQSGRTVCSQVTPQTLTKPLDGAVPQARVDPRTIRIAVIDGTENRFARLSTTDGLSQRRVSQIVQDDRGFMWFGTQYGLNRYDRYDVKVFVPDPGNPNR